MHSCADCLATAFRRAAVYESAFDHAFAPHPPRSLCPRTEVSFSSSCAKGGLDFQPLFHSSFYEGANVAAAVAAAVAVLSG